MTSQKRISNQHESLQQFPTLTDRSCITLRTDEVTIYAVLKRILDRSFTVLIRSKVGWINTAWANQEIVFNFNSEVIGTGGLTVCIRAVELGFKI